jgi:hypothetical protein
MAQGMEPVCADCMMDAMRMGLVGVMVVTSVLHALRKVDVV